MANGLPGTAMISLDLIKLQREYIKLLEEENWRTAAYLQIHGQQPSDDKVEQGKQLREKIKELDEFNE